MFKVQNISLSISMFVVVPVGIIYGFQPDLLFDIQATTTDLRNVLKALMGIYLAFSIVWMLGVFNRIYWKIALISNIVFMCGLAFGRILSMVFDGIPSPLFVVGTIGELVLGMYGWHILTKNHKRLITDAKH